MFAAARPVRACHNVAQRDSAGEMTLLLEKPREGRERHFRGLMPPLKGLSLQTTLLPTAFAVGQIMSALTGLA
jgi:hypothetical protein